jgi:hypothetical protein
MNGNNFPTKEIEVKQTLYEPIPQGEYPAVIERIELDDKSVFGAQLKFTFKLDPFEDYPDGKELVAWCSMKFTKKSKLYLWTRQVNGDIPRDYNFHSTDLLNKRVRVMVGRKRSDDGTEFDRVNDVLPPRDARKTEAQLSAAMAQVEAESPF